MHNYEPTQPAPQTVEDLQAAETAERRRAELAQEHYDALLGGVLNQGSDVDEQGAYVVGMTATHLARVDMIADPQDRARQERELLLDLLAVEGQQPVVARLVPELMDHRRMSPLTEEERQRVADKKEQNRVVAEQMGDIYGRLHELLGHAPDVTVTDSVNTILETLASEYHGLRYGTAPQDVDLLRKNLLDKYETAIREQGLPSGLAGIARTLLSS